METEIQPKLHYKTTEVAELLNCSTRHVTNLMRAGKLKYWKDGTYNKVPAVELERYIEEGYQRATERREGNLCTHRMEDGDLCSNYVASEDLCYTHSKEKDDMSDPIGRTSEQYTEREKYSELLIVLYKLGETIQATIDDIEEIKREEFQDAN